jgi:hypothetical protein
MEEDDHACCDDASWRGRVVSPLDLGVSIALAASICLLSAVIGYPARLRPARRRDSKPADRP